jgi:hypothetical protein
VFITGQTAAHSATTLALVQSSSAPPASSAKFGGAEYGAAKHRAAKLGIAKFGITKSQTFQHSNTRR